jgi:transcription elongation GreA/GreB family factor
MQLHKRRADESRTQDGEPVYLTKQGIERLRAELDNLKRRLPQLAQEAQRNAAYGDRSDNAEYKQAKGALRFAHRQIFTIESQLKRAVPIEANANSAAAGTVQLGSTVVLLASDGTERTFEILGPEETNPSAGRISYLSPLGAALLNHKKDDVVKVTTQGGEQTYQILEIKVMLK